MLWCLQLMGDGSITAHRFYAKELCMGGDHKVKMFTQYRGSAWRSGTAVRVPVRQRFSVA